VEIPKSIGITRTRQPDQVRINEFYTVAECALCDTCCWSATLLKHRFHQRTINVCPICNNRKLSFIPLEKDESYKLSMGPIRGLELEFSLRTVNRKSEIRPGPG